jgi:hypothetical protein
MKKKYAAFILDIKNSKSMDEEVRGNCQKKLLKIVEFINNIFFIGLEEKIVFAAGDSVQGLFNNANNAVLSYHLVKHLFYPYEIRCGIGFGTINEIIKTIKEEDKHLNSNFVDGNSYHLAINAINTAKEKNYNILIFSDNYKNDIVINQILHTCMTLELLQTPYQKDVFNMFNLLFPISYGNKQINSFYYDFVIKFLKSNLQRYKIIKDKFYYDDLYLRISQYLSKNQIDDEKTFIKQGIFIDTLIPPSLNEYSAQLLGVTRQNIEQKVEKGNFNEIRKLEVLAVMLSEENY